VSLEPLTESWVSHPKRREERVKLRATFLSYLGAASIAAGLIVPSVSGARDVQAILLALKGEGGPKGRMRGRRPLRIEPIPLTRRFATPSPLKGRGLASAGAPDALP
jgi:hypothetical protein